MIWQILTAIILSSTAVKGIIGYDNGGQTEYAFTPNFVPQDVPTPAMTYKVLSIDSLETKDGYSGIDKYLIQLDLFSKNYETLDKLDAAVRSVMNSSEGEYAVTDFDDNPITVDVGVSRHSETTEIYFEEAEIFSRSTEYNIITNRS